MKRTLAYKFLKSRILQHLLFWSVSWYLLLRIFTGSAEIRQIDLIYTTFFILPVAGCVYVNICLLFPLFLEKKLVLPYLLLQSVSIAGFSWLNMLIFSHFIDVILPGYYFISYYDFQDLLKFFFSFILISTLLKLAKGWFQLTEARGNLERLEKMHARAELESLKGQINPHFLFNSLNTLYAMVMKKSDAAPGYILKLSGLLRYLLYETTSPAVDLDKELACMSDYIDLQKLRAGPLATVSFEVSGSCAGKMIAPLLFLPLIENSFKHGIKGETGASFVHIVINISEDAIEFDIRNNCGYVDEVEKKGSSGIGLENLQKRLDLVYPGICCGWL